VRFRVKITCDAEYTVEKVVVSHWCLNWAVALALVGGQPTRPALEVAKIVRAVFELARCDGDTPEERQLNIAMLEAAQSLTCYWERYDAEFEKQMAELNEPDEPTGGHK